MKMNIPQMIEKIKEAYSIYQDDYYYIGIRFENKQREIGEECEYSRHNPNREDEREFPHYGTERYDGMEDLDGTSAWDLSDIDSVIKWTLPRDYDENKEASRYFLTEHCYIIASNQKGYHDNPDDNEILIKNAKVVDIIF